MLPTARAPGYLARGRRRLDGWANAAQLKAFAGDIVLVGCGSIGQTVLPLLVRDLGIEPARLTVVTADQRGRRCRRGSGRAVPGGAADARQSRAGAGRPARAGDFLLNLSVEVASLELLRFANQSRRALSRHRDRALARRLHRSRLSPASAPARRFAPGRWPARGDWPGRPTAVICQGANPGLVSQLVKAAALELARALADEVGRPGRAEAGRRLFRGLGIRTIQIAEHDSQVSRTPRAAGEFVSTWSVDGFLSEGIAAGRARLGHREGGAADRRPPAHRLTGPGSICCARRRRAGAQLGARGRPVRRLPDHPHGSRCRSPTI